MSLPYVRVGGFVRARRPKPQAMADPKSIDEVFTACGLDWEQFENLILC